MEQSNKVEKKNAGSKYRILNTWAVIAMVGMFLSLGWIVAAPSTGKISTVSAYTVTPTPKPVMPSNKPAAPSPAATVALNDARKAGLGKVEMGFFRSSLGSVNFVKESSNYKGQSYEIYKNSNDPGVAIKVVAVNRAVKLIVDKGLRIPNALRLYLTNEFAAQNRAFPRDETWSEVAYVVLGPAALEGGRPDAFSATGFLGESKPTITTIHEIGHILHERSLGDPFWATGSIIAGAPSTGSQVSGYANSSKKEFVAEVFAGLVLGKRWPTEVLNEYRRYSGPIVP